MSSIKRVFVAGHRGMVGSAIVRQLEAQGNVQIITRIRAELDLTSQMRFRNFLKVRVLIKSI